MVDHSSKYFSWNDSPADTDNTWDIKAHFHFTVKSYHAKPY